MAHELFKRLLQEESLCTKTVVVEDEVGCKLYYCSHHTTPLLVAFNTYRNWVYARIVPENLVKPYTWHCRDILYTPYGLYVFAETVEELVGKIKGRMKLLQAQLALGLERQAKTGAV